MKKIISVFIALVALTLGTGAFAAPFTAGNLVILQVGNGESETNIGNAAYLVEYTPSFSFVQSIPLPTAYFGANSPLILSGTATAEGLISRSADGRFILVAGYGATVGQFTNFSLPSTFSTEAPRVVGLVDGNGHIDTTTVATNSRASGEDFRSAASTDGTNIWFSGDTSGIRYTTRGVASDTQLSTFVTNIRQLNIFNNQLYFSDASGSSVRIGVVTNAMPVTTNGFYASLAGLPTTNGSPYGFVFLNLSGGPNPYDTLYVADDGLGAVLKYALVGTNWNNVGSVSAGGARGLAANSEISGGTTNAHLYITSGAGNNPNGDASFYSYVDHTGYNVDPILNGDGASPPLQEVTGVNFRGIAFVPVGGETYPSGPGTLSVGPVLDFFSTGLTGCSDSSTMTYSLANVGTTPINWSATSDQPSWVTLTPSSGSLNPNVATTVTVSLNVASLPTGTNAATITFANTSNGNGNTTRPVTEVMSPVSILPSTDFNTSGQPGGPFTPTTKTYSLTNGGTAFNYSVGSTANWVTVSPTNGLLGACSGVTITLTLNANANTLGAGNFSSVIAFSNKDANALIDTRNVTLASGFVFFFDDFSTFSQNTDVNGQNGWLQLGSTATLPLQVTNNTLVFAPRLTAAAQTVYKNFPLLTNPATFVGMRVAITAAATNGVNLGNTGPSYIGTIYTGNNGTTTSGTFPNYRFTARALNAGTAGTNGYGATYILGTRNNGQAGAPWDYGSQAVLNTGQVINLILMTDANGSNSTLYVNPTSAVLGAQTPYVTAMGGTNGSAFAADLGVGSFGLSQFGSAAVPGDGANFYKICASTNYADVYNFLNAGPFRITSAVRSGNNIVLTWNSIPGSNTVQFNTSTNYNSTSFATLAVLTNLSFGVTNYVDIGAATNKPARYYRIKGSQ